MSQNKDHWSSPTYTSAASFVPLLTTRVLSLLSPQPGDSILDLGCGDGALTTRLAAAVGATGYVLGLDASPAMVAAAAAAARQQQHGHEVYAVHDCGTALAAQAQVRPRWAAWDSVFSNAALHWILRAEGAREGLLFADVYGALRPGGRFVFEMGGKGNVAEVHAAVVAGLVASGGVGVDEARASVPWFFPSEVWMRGKLEEAGFKVEVCETEYRPTRLTVENEEGSGGLEGWVKLMAAQCLEVVEEAKRDAVVKMVCEVLKGIITREEDGSQWIGYVRLRAVAVKP